MSQENVDVIRRAVDHFNDKGVPAWHLMDPGLRFTTRGDIESSTTYTGRDGLEQATSNFAGVWDSIRWELQKVIGGDDTFVLALHIYVRGKGSGVEIETDEYWAVWMRGGKFIRIDQYGNRQEALEAAGLRE